MDCLRTLHRIFSSPQNELSMELQGAICQGIWHSSNKLNSFRQGDINAKKFRKRFNLNMDQFNNLLAGDPNILVKTYKHYIKWSYKHFGTKRLP